MWSADSLVLFKERYARGRFENLIVQMCRSVHCTAQITYWWNNCFWERSSTRTTYREEGRYNTIGWWAQPQGRFGEEGFLWQSAHRRLKCVIAIDHLIDHKPLLKFRMAVLGGGASVLKLFCVGGLIDSIIIILSLQISAWQLYYLVCFLNDGFTLKMNGRPVLQ